MRKDIDNCSRQIDLLKYRANSFVTKEVVDIHIKDLDDTMRRLVDQQCKLV